MAEEHTHTHTSAIKFVCEVFCLDLCETKQTEHVAQIFFFFFLDGLDLHLFLSWIPLTLKNHKQTIKHVEVSNAPLTYDTAKSR